MKKLFLLLALCSFTCLLSAQKTANDLYNEGVGLYEIKEYGAAIKKFEEAIAIDKDHYRSHYERSYAMVMMKDYEGCIKASEQLIRDFPNGEHNDKAYLNWGTALDMLGKGNESIKVYQKGIKKYPTFALLYFNSAITYYGMGKTEEAQESAELSLKHNPYHASSHNVVSILQDANRIYSLMASLSFLAIEPASQRSPQHLKNVLEKLGGNVKKTGEKDISILLTLPSGSDKKNKENNFGSVELLMSMSAALTLSEENKNKSALEKMRISLESVFSMLDESKKEKGFGWKFYAPFLSDLKKAGHTETFCHYIYVSAKDAENEKWLEDNKEKVAAFETWFRSYSWNK